MHLHYEKRRPGVGLRSRFKSKLYFDHFVVSWAKVYTSPSLRHAAPPKTGNILVARRTKRTNPEIVNDVFYKIMPGYLAASQLFFLYFVVVSGSR